ncbi:MAG: YedE-related selenium metabolism membrane protein [Lachnospiraceae bacterium]|nr:YedE-related selenium metabolism membrane protein [Lachnospiraceae bacterium]
MQLDSKWKLAVAGGLTAAVAALLAIFGNPRNMAFCIACFIRDTAGALKFHSAAPVQYVRPEIIGLILGAFLIAVATKEFRATGGSSPMIRFLLGMVIMIGALVFLGCPLRMVIRMSAGDWNAYVALVGFVCGIGTGSIALRKGFSLGRANNTNAASGAVLPLIAVAIFALLVAAPSLLAFSESGPGSMHAPIAYALIGGLVVGVLAQKSRMCFAGGVRDVILLKNFDLISVIGGLFVVLLIFNIATQRFTPGFTVPGTISHPEHVWNFLGMYAVGFAAVLAGGCPLRQLILAAQGSSDAAVTVIGMFVGSALCHNFGLAASGTAKNADTGEITLGAVPQNGKIAVVICIIVCFVIAFTQKRKEVSK